MKQQEIDRINELSRLSRERELTQMEQEERARLRRAYIDSVKANLEAQLQNTYIVDEKGNKSPLNRR